LKNLFWILFLFLSACSSCEREKPASVVTQPAQEQIVAEFNADSAYAFVKAQTDFGPRVPGTKAHAECAEYLISTLKRFTTQVLVQKAQVTTYNSQKLNIQNIIAQFNPGAQKRILLFAHWDTRPWADQDTVDSDRPVLGADDGGSGVGVLLEIARQLSARQLSIGVDIIFFDAEDYGTRKGERSADNSYALGTQHWCRNPMPEGYSANYGILLDMVGAKGATFLMEGYSMQYAPSIVKKVWDTGNRLGYSDYFLYRQGEYFTDDHKFVNELSGIPSVDIIHQNIITGSFGTHWHTHADNMGIIDRNTLKAVGHTVLYVVLSEMNI
jgi:Zn-dependent M28 family amino/carboxypeptidase